MSRRPSSLARVCLILPALLLCGLRPATAEDAPKPPPAKTASSLPVNAPPTTAELLRNAETAAQEGRWPAAIRGWQSVLEREPARLEIRHRLADALLAQGRSAEARAEYEQLMRQAPNADIQLRLIELLRDAGSHIAALKLAEQGQGSFPNDTRFVPLRIELLLRLGDRSGADQLASSLPKNREGWLAEGQLAERNAQWARACQAYRRALAADGGKTAEAGLQRCRQQTIQLGRWRAFAAPDWQAVPAQASFRHRQLGSEVQVLAAPAGKPEEALQAVLAARLPRELLTPPAPPEVLAAFAAKSAEHQAGKDEHTNASEADHQAVLKALQAPFEVTLDASKPGQAQCVRAAPRPEVDASGMPLPVMACLAPENALIYVLTAKMDASAARQALNQMIAAGRVEE